MLVLKLCSKGQLRPSIFRLATLIPQLLILGQTHSYAYMGLHINMKLNIKRLFYPICLSIYDLSMKFE
jgi:hypothetical protein